MKLINISTMNFHKYIDKQFVHPHWNEEQIGVVCMNYDVQKFKIIEKTCIQNNNNNNNKVLDSIQPDIIIYFFSSTLYYLRKSNIR